MSYRLPRPIITQKLAPTRTWGDRQSISQRRLVTISPSSGLNSQQDSDLLLGMLHVRVRCGVGMP